MLDDLESRAPCDLGGYSLVLYRSRRREPRRERLEKPRPRPRATAMQREGCERGREPNKYAYIIIYI